MLFSRPKTHPVAPEQALPGRPDYPFPIPDAHAVLGHPLRPPFPAGLHRAVFGMGCFWGAEELFWQLPGVWTTAVGYAGGQTAHPTYEEVCTGLTGHSEAVQVVFDPQRVQYPQLLSVFFQTHDPTQGMRQGNDVGSQYRSAIYYTDEAQRGIAEAAIRVVDEQVRSAGYGTVTTELAEAGQFYFAEGYHQQYLAKNPNGYRCHSNTGLSFPAELFTAAG